MAGLLFIVRSSGRVGAWHLHGASHPNPVMWRLRLHEGWERERNNLPTPPAALLASYPDLYELEMENKARTAEAWRLYGRTMLVRFPPKRTAILDVMRDFLWDDAAAWQRTYVMELAPSAPRDHFQAHLGQVLAVGQRLSTFETACDHLERGYADARRLAEEARAIADDALASATERYDRCMRVRLRLDEYRAQAFRLSTKLALAGLHTPLLDRTRPGSALSMREVPPPPPKARPAGRQGQGPASLSAAPHTPRGAA